MFAWKNAEPQHWLSEQATRMELPWDCKMTVPAADRSLSEYPHRGTDQYHNRGMGLPREQRVALSQGTNVVVRALARAQTSRHSENPWCFSGDRAEQQCVGCRWAVASALSDYLRGLWRFCCEKRHRSSDRCAVQRND